MAEKAAKKKKKNLSKIRDFAFILAVDMFR